MKHRVSLTLAVSALLGSTLFALASRSAQSAVNFDWMAFGETLNKGPKYKLGVADAKKIVAKVADQMIRLKVPVNNNWGGRVSSAARYGQQDIGTCTYINTAIQRALLGAGFRQDQIFGVIGVGQGSENAGVATEAEHTLRSVAWVNLEHIAPAIVIGNDVIVFDLWHHAFDTGSFTGAATSKWNGRSLISWCTGVKHYPGFMFSMYDLPPAPGQKAVHPGLLQEQIRENQYYQRFPNQKPKPKKQPPGQDSPVGARAPTVSHWAFVEAKPVPIDNPPNTRDPRRYSRCRAEGGSGSLVVTGEWNDLELKPHFSKVTVTWNASPDLRYLVPGQKFKVSGTVTLSGEISRTSFGVHWHPPGFPAHVGHTSGINLYGNDFAGAGGSFEFEAQVPAKDRYPQGVMVLRFVSYANGNGAVEYAYRWVEKK